MINYEEIGLRIRKARKNKGLSQEELAEKIYISTTHMSHIETGSTKLSLPVLVDIANALQISSDELLFGSTQQVQKIATERLEEFILNCSKEQATTIKLLAEKLSNLADTIK